VSRGGQWVSGEASRYTSWVIERSVKLGNTKSSNLAPVARIFVLR
jgi:hypothetical protein